MKSLKVQVVATTVDGTRAALVAARTMAAGLGARIDVVVPHVVPYGEAIEHPTIAPTFVGRRIQALADQLSMDVDVRVCVCRTHTAALTQWLVRDAVVLVGGRRRRGWPTREQRLAVSLAEHGYNALFVAEPYSPHRDADVSGIRDARPHNTPENTHGLWHWPWIDKHRIQTAVPTGREEIP